MTSLGDHLPESGVTVSGVESEYIHNATRSVIGGLGGSCFPNCAPRNDIAAFPNRKFVNIAVLSSRLFVNVEKQNNDKIKTKPNYLKKYPSKEP